MTKSQDALNFVIDIINKRPNSIIKETSKDKYCAFIKKMLGD